MLLTSPLKLRRHGHACRPQGQLRISILPCWLRHSRPEADGLTELSGLSFGVSANSSAASGSSDKAFEDQVMHCWRQLRQCLCGVLEHTSPQICHVAAQKEGITRGAQHLWLSRISPSLYIKQRQDEYQSKFCLLRAPSSAPPRLF